MDTQGRIFYGEEGVDLLINRQGPNINEIYDEVLRLKLYPVELRGTDRLFREHWSFVNSEHKFSERPLLHEPILLQKIYPSLSDPVNKVILIDRLENKLPGIVNGLYNALSKHPRSDMHLEKVDISVVEAVNSMYMKIPQRTYHDVRMNFKDCSNDKCPGGKIGQKANRGRPLLQIKMRGNLETVYLYSFGEVKKL